MAGIFSHSMQSLRSLASKVSDRVSRAASRAGSQKLSTAADAEEDEDNDDSEDDDGDMQFRMVACCHSHTMLVTKKSQEKGSGLLACGNHRCSLTVETGSTLVLC